MQIEAAATEDERDEDDSQILRRSRRVREPYLFRKDLTRESCECRSQGNYSETIENEIGVRSGALTSSSCECASFVCVL